jgi:hypothetical protein
MIYYNQCLDVFKKTGKPPVDTSGSGSFNLGKWVRRQISENLGNLTE